MSVKSLEAQIREKMLSGAGENLKSLIINESQIALVNAISRAGYMTAREASTKYGIAEQHSIDKLERLVLAGYLSSKPIKTPGKKQKYCYSVNLDER